VAKVIFRDMKIGRSRRSTAPSVGRKVVGIAGSKKTLHTLDAHSDTFDDDLRYVFGKNVAKARRDNKRITGSTDIGPRKR
jgi:hypothetical protein